MKALETAVQVPFAEPILWQLQKIKNGIIDKQRKRRRAGAGVRRPYHKSYCSSFGGSKPPPYGAV
jgi:hypothetical protein